MEKFCPKCGTQLLENGKFCISCGLDIAQHAAQSDNSTDGTEQKTKTKLKSRKPFIIAECAAVAVTLVVTLAVTGVFGLFNSDGNGGIGGLFENVIGNNSSNGDNNKNNKNGNSGSLGTDGAISEAYPGIQITGDFSIIANRVAQINGGNLAGGAYDAEGEAELARAIERYLNMTESDIDDYIQMLRDNGISEENLANIRKNEEEKIQSAKDGTFAQKYRSQYITPSNLTRYPLKQLGENEAMNGYDPDDWDATANWAIGIASDLATAMTFGYASPGLMQAAGLAVSVYPHPLLLNNYASILRADSPRDALFFYIAALEFEPQNPIILANIGMTYLEMGYLDVAKGYAELALQYNPDCGYAYQILTLNHLYEENYVLAAETLFKSTRECFDDMTIELFESYLAAVEELSYQRGDEFPINDLVLELLYESARTNVDTNDMNDQLDTPNAQLEIKDYPYFGGVEDYMNTVQEVWQANVDEKYPVLNEAFDRKYDLQSEIFKGKYSTTEDGELILLSNIRQYYAFLVLKSYYGFYHQQEFIKACFSDEDRSDRVSHLLSEEFCEQLIPMVDKQAKAADDAWNEFENELKSLQEQIKSTNNKMGGNNSNEQDFRLRLEVIRLEKLLDETTLRYKISSYETSIENLDKLYNLCKSYADICLHND